MGSIIFNQIVMMFIILIVGAIAYKGKIISQAGVKEMSNLLLMVVNPIVIALSFQRDFDGELLRNFLVIFFLTMASYIILILAARLTVSGKNKETGIERFCVVFSNCGYFGIPLVSSLFGLEGVFYLAAYLMAFNLCVWSYGLCLIKGEKGLSAKGILKNMCNLNIIAVVLGFVMFILGIRLPDNLFVGLSYLGDMNTALSMIVAGATLAQADIKRILGMKRVYYVCFIRLILTPLCILGLLKLIPLNPMLSAILLIASACPVATTGIMFTLKFEKNVEYMSAIYIMSTLLALGTIPAIFYIY